MILPQGANDVEETKPDATIRNTYHMKEFLTEREAIDLIGWLAARLLVEKTPIPEEHDDGGC
jgi:hypothetical protein